MRIAIVSDVHGNRTAFEAVVRDLREAAPDLVLHGGDLACPGSAPCHVVDRIRDLGWPGVLGNADEMLFRPELIAGSLRGMIVEMADAAREAPGDERVEWLRTLPMVHVEGTVALIHASPESAWISPMPEASDDELSSVYAPLGRPMVVYGHVHKSFIRRLPGLTVVNTGSVSLSYDGDARAAYVLLDHSVPIVRRVEYDIAREVEALRDCGLPHSEWVAKMLASARFEMP